MSVRLVRILFCFFSRSCRVFILLCFFFFFACFALPCVQTPTMAADNERVHPTGIPYTMTPPFQPGRM